MFENVIDSPPEINKPLSAKYKRSFAYPTFAERAPQILDGVIQRLKNQEKRLQNDRQGAIAEICSLSDEILKLKNEMKSDHPITEIPLHDDVINKGAKIYNRLIEEKKRENGGKYPSWFQTEWLFAECYMYFKLHDIFSTSTFWKAYDPFVEVKVETLLGSKDAVISLASWLVNVKSFNILIFHVLF